MSWTLPWIRVKRLLLGRIDPLEANFADLSGQIASMSGRLANVEALGVESGEMIVNMQVLLADLADELNDLADATGTRAKADALGAEAALAVLKIQAQLDEVRATVAAGAQRLDQLQSADAQETARAKDQQVQLARLDASVRFLEKRINDEAEQSRRGLSGLYDQLRSDRVRNTTEQ